MTLSCNQESEEERTDMINLYIGKFDLKKILQKTQTLKIKKGEFVNDFIYFFMIIVVILHAKNRCHFVATPVTI